MKKTIIFAMKLLVLNIVATTVFLVVLLVLGYNMDPIHVMGMGLVSAFVAGLGLISGAISTFSFLKRKKGLKNHG